MFCKLIRYDALKIKCFKLKLIEIIKKNLWIIKCNDNSQFYLQFKIV